MPKIIKLLPILRCVEDFFIPPLCVVCDSALGNDGDRWFCPACINALAANHSQRDDVCPRCSQNRRKRECACEFAWDFSFEKVFSAYDYDSTVSSIAKHIKYKGKSRLAYHTGVVTAPLLPREFFMRADMVVPVPLHKSKMRRRGYNQAEHFARGVLNGLNGGGAGLGLKLRTDLLIRVKNTGTQTKLDREDRLQNLIGAFAANPQKITELKGKNVILVDDIFTTGATAESCAEELLRAGCATVRVLAMGRD
ncbi:MAG: ComF family protein [Chitinispirillales bacterium]|nr:ComF family protein [Chitinispirillales bacterium]